MSDQNEIVKGPGVGHDKAQPLHPEPAQVAPFLFKIVEGLLFEHAVRLKEAIQRSARFVSKQFPKPGPVQMSALVGEIVRNLHYQIHRPCPCFTL
jgi:hypothetical protein